MKKDHEALSKSTFELCYDYQFDKYWALSLTSFVSALVSIINILIRNFIMLAIGYIHYDSKSQVTN